MMHFLVLYNFYATLIVFEIKIKNIQFIVIKNDRKSVFLKT